MTVALVKVNTTDPVDDPTLITGIVKTIPPLVVAVRNTTGGTINTFVLVPGTGLTAEWQSGTPISLANNAQVNIVLTFDDTLIRRNFATTFQVQTSGADPSMNLTLNFSQPTSKGIGARRGRTRARH